MLSQAEPSFLNFWGLKCNRIDDGKTPTNRTIQEYTVAKQPKTLNRDYLSINSRSQSIFLLLLEAIGRLPFALLTRNYSLQKFWKRDVVVFIIFSLCVWMRRVGGGMLCCFSRSILVNYWVSKIDLMTLECTPGTIFW